MTEFSPEITDTEYIGRAKPEMQVNQFTGNTSIGYTDEDIVYVKNKNEFLESNLAAGLTLQQLPVVSPRVDYQDNRVVFENLEGFEPVESLEDAEDFDSESYLEAIASKALVGDMDVSYNILVNDGVFGTCDYDFAGTSIDLIPPLSIRDYEQNHKEMLGCDFDEGDLKSKTGEIAREVDEEELEEILASFDLLTESGYKDRMVENVRKAQNW